MPSKTVRALTSFLEMDEGLLRQPKRKPQETMPPINSHAQLNQLVNYLQGKGFTVSFVGNKVLHDYAAMNPEYARANNWPSGKREFQVDKNLPMEKQSDNLRHEIIEYNLMKAKMPYGQAHLIALKLEGSPLGIPEIERLAKLGQYQVEHVHDDGDLTISKNGTQFVLTTEGQIFKQQGGDMKKKAGKLTYEERQELPDKEFAVVTKTARKYPIDTENRARNALARVSYFGSPREKHLVRKAVKRRYPRIKGQFV